MSAREHESLDASEGFHLEQLDPHDELNAIFQLNQFNDAVFTASPQETTLFRVFGGHIAGQALYAAGQTVPAEYSPHSLYASFLRPGDPQAAITYTVERVRDGRSLSSRRVLATQHDKPIFQLTASFEQLDTDGGPEHSDAMPDVPDPDDVPPPDVRLNAGSLDIRHLTPHPWRRRNEDPMDPGHRCWVRSNTALPDRTLIHACVAIYLSDANILDAVLTQHHLYWGVDQVTGASLDHAMWFHRPPRLDTWTLYEITSPTAARGRGFATGKLYSRSGELVASIAQEGILKAH